MSRLSHLLLACTGVAIAACGDSPTDGPETFTASFASASSTGAPGGRCPAITVGIAAPGTSTPGGAFTTAQSHCVDPGSESGAFTDGIFRFAYAGGDEISGTYQGQLVPTGDPEVFTIDGEFTITDGAGEFDGATGGGDAGGTTNLATGAAALELTGTIER